MTPTLPSNCIGTGNLFPPMWTARRRKGRPSSRRTECAASPSRPRPSGLRFYHTHNRAGADLHAGQYSGQVGPVYIEPKSEPGSYDREVFLVLKEFEPMFSQGGDMAMDFLAPATRVKQLEDGGRVRDEGFARQGHAARL